MLLPIIASTVGAMLTGVWVCNHNWTMASFSALATINFTIYCAAASIKDKK